MGLNRAKAQSKSGGLLNRYFAARACGTMGWH